MMLEMVAGETVCVWNLVCGEGFLCGDFRGASGREILKRRRGKRWFDGFVGWGGIREGQGKTKGGQVWGFGQKGTESTRNL